MCRSVLQCAAVRCSALEGAVVCVAVCESLLQCAAVCQKYRFASDCDRPCIFECIFSFLVEEALLN